MSADTAIAKGSELRGGGGLLGLAWGLIGVLKAATGRVTVRWPWLALALVVGIVVGLATLKVTYLDQSGWTVEDNAWGTLAAAFGGGSAGSVAGLLPKAMTQTVSRLRRRGRN